MKIAFIGQKGIPAVQGGGVEVYVENLATRLSQKGHQVLVYSRRGYTKSDRKNYKGVKVINLPTIYRKNLEAIIHTFLASLDILRRDVDIIHYQAIGPSSLCFIPRLLKPKTKIISTFHCRDYCHQKWGFLAQVFLRFGEWVTVRIPHKTVTISQSLQDFVREKYGKEIFYISQGLRPLSPENPSKGLLKKWGLEPQKYLLLVSRFVPHKGIHQVISVFKELPWVYKQEFKLVIVGGGEASYTASYERYLKKLGASESQIIFTGPQFGKILDTLFAKAYLFIQASSSEGLSMTLLEALASGTPALVSDIPENREAYDLHPQPLSINFQHLVFKTGDVQDLKKKLIWLFQHPEFIQEISPKLKEKIIAQYSWDRLIDSYDKLYQED